jgi:anti-anti-sigma factor
MFDGISVATFANERLPVETTPVVLGTRLMQCGRTLWLELQGVLNWCTTDLFRRHVSEGLVHPCRRVVADLTRVEYVGGNGLRALLTPQEELAARNVELRLVVPEGSRCARTLAMAKLDGVLQTFAHPARAWQHRDPQPHASRRHQTDLARAQPVT